MSVWDGEPCFNKTEKESKIEKFITHGSWCRYTACLEGPRGEVKTGCKQRERGVRQGGVQNSPWVQSWTKAGLVLQKKKKEFAFSVQLR